MAAQAQATLLGNDTEHEQFEEDVEQWTVKAVRRRSGSRHSHRTAGIFACIAIGLIVMIIGIVIGVLLLTNVFEKSTCLPKQEPQEKQEHQDHQRQEERELELLQLPNQITVVANTTELVESITAAAMTTFATESTTENENDEESKEMEKLSDNCDPQFPWQNLRLPKDIKPISYRLHFHPNLTKLTFSGTVEIELDVINVTNFIVLHASPSLNATSLAIRISGFTNRPKVLTCIRLCQWALLLDKPIKPGVTVNLVIEYTGLIHTDFSGFYANTHISGKGKRIVSAVTQFEPTNARKMLPCFDEPSFKATFEISVTREKRHTVLSNMHRIKTDLSKNGLVRDYFAKSLKMSTYLLAIAVLDDFECAQRTTRETSEPITISLYAASDVITNQTEFGLTVAVKSMEFFENYFGIPYSLPKQDLLALNDFAEGAMENWGLTTFRDAVLLHDPERSTTKSKEGVALVVCHEHAHQWFGNLVTMKWWNDLWLNEGFAMFMEYFCVDKFYPRWKIMDEFYVENFVPSMIIDAFDTSHAVSTEVDDPAEIGSIFDAISYHKAASIIGMISALAGEKKFQKSLQEYLQFYAYGNAESTDLWQTVDKHISLKTDNISLAAFAEAWTMQIGYPYLTVSLDNEHGYIIIHNQTRFLFLEELRYRNDATHWPIAIYYRTDSSGSEEHIKWMSPHKQRVRISVKKHLKWVLANARSKGYYRVLYDQKLYKEIIRQFRKRHTAFHAVERASLINDAFAFAKAGLLPIDTAMDMISYVEKNNEIDRIPWNVIIMQLNSINSLSFESVIYDSLQRYMRMLVMKIYDKMGWTQKSLHTDRLLQTEILSFACKIGISDCKKQAKKLFYQWKNDKSVPVDLQPLIVEEGIKQGTKPDWEFVLDKYKKAKIPSQKFLLLGALMATIDQRLINRSLDMCLDSSLVKPNVLPKALGLLMQNREAQQYTWRFFRMHFEDFNKALGTTTMLGITIKSLIENFSTDFDLTEAKAFFEGKKLGPSQLKVKQALDLIRVNIQWRRLNEQALGKWLQRYHEKQIS